MANQFTRVEREVQKILTEEICNLEEFPKIIRDLKEKLDVELSELLRQIDKLEAIHMAYIDGNLTKQQKDEQVVDTRIDVTFYNRAIKELLLTIQDRTDSYTKVLHSLTIEDDKPEADKLLVEQINEAIKDLNIVCKHFKLGPVVNITTRRVIFFFQLDPISPELVEDLISCLVYNISSIVDVQEISNVNYKLDDSENHNLRIVLDIKKCS